MDDWGWEQMRPWLAHRVSMPVGPLFCVIDGPTRGKPWTAPSVRLQLRRLAAQAGVRRRFAPHQLRHAHAVEMAREGVPLNVIQRQLGHANLRVTSIYLQGIDSAEIINAIGRRRSPGTLPGYHAGRAPRTRDAAIPPTRPGSRKSSPSCAKSARTPAATGFAG